VISNVVYVGGLLCAVMRLTFLQKFYQEKALPLVADASVVHRNPVLHWRQRVRRQPLSSNIAAANRVPRRHIDVNIEDELRQVLREYFGHDDFRPGQLDVARALCSGKDSAVFWATGAGKSMAYQIPALKTRKTAIIVSPLISLMVDQVNNFNATAGTMGVKPKACYLGSAQVDPMVETCAVRGDYLLVYVTPEKLTLGFLKKLEPLQKRGQLSLLAVDEAHCISEWGHDFRPSYRELKNIREQLPNVPIVALTATAVSRVQTDIVEQLGLRSPLVSRTSFDRPNLVLRCRRKVGRVADYECIAAGIEKGGSTIVYVPTQAETEALSSFLSEKLPAGSVRTYHGGLPLGAREKAHLDFLSGTAKAVVATVAFGMGIDKPDIRRVVHYGPPKTVEEYLQQVGRAGRDGFPAMCELVAADSDFVGYSADFYTQGLTEDMKKRQLESTTALRVYALGATCRRKWLLEYLGEAPTFSSCGTCDVCVSAKGGNELTRNFRQAAEPILRAAQMTEDFPQAMTAFLQILRGTYSVPGFVGQSQRRVLAALPEFRASRDRLKPVMRTEAFTKELIGLLAVEGYLCRKQQSVTTSSGYKNNFETYKVTEKGKGVLQTTDEIRLTVPQGLRQVEEAQRRKTEELKNKLSDDGVNLSQIPEHELEACCGPTLDAFRGWAGKLKCYRSRGLEDMAKKCEAVHRLIEEWRDEAARAFHMAPASVLSNTLVIRLATVMPTSEESIRDVGVRFAGARDLAKVILDAKTRYFGEIDVQGSRDAGNEDAVMIIPQGQWTPPSKWSKELYKPGKNGAPPVWEVTYRRFMQGEHCEKIAMTQPNKPIQISTVCTHVFTAVRHGRQLDLQRLVTECGLQPPSKRQWEQMEELAVAKRFNLNDDFAAKDMLRGVLGDNVDRPPLEKSEEERSIEAVWYGRIRWWETFRKVSYTPAFECVKRARSV